MAMEHLETVLNGQRAALRSSGGRIYEVRKRLLTQLKSFLVAEEPLLLEALRADLGRGWLEGWSAEIGFTLADISHALRHLKRWMKPRRQPASPVMLPGRAKVSREPFGSVLIIGPFNYPVQLLFAPLVAALAAGNRVVLKPSDRCTAVEKVLVERLPDYFTPEEVHITTGALEETRWLLREGVDMVCFTGSTETGRRVMADAAARPIPALLELGGVNPVYIGADAQLAQAARRICWGKFFNAGQTCLAPNHLVVEQGQLAPLVEALKATLVEFYGDNPRGAEDYGRLVDSAAAEQMAAYIQKGEVLIGGDVDAEHSYCAPTLLKVAPDSPLLTQELFGPVLPIVVVESLEEEIRRSPWHESPLAVYGFGGRWLEQLLAQYSRSGSVVMNGTLHRIVSTTIPFGGVGTSGIGNYHGSHGFNAFSYERVYVSKHPTLEMPGIYPPYTMPQQAIRWLHKFL